ncbi:MAG TPA: penicillin-binding protein 2 [Planctomycetaceae bacterium]|uniref:peptidoglycan D,D-transpeptidase FtsI family protein n=3 Tax=Gimesia TaxID=1649453 RepID=UPI000C48FD8B|nr:penicillin-binding protein 2 [Gimesia sp.]MAX40225.1 penicillin-binding protein [Gimesia sp.]HAH48928.1 penicillin-binding protein 2 [Planctomycetaceae bacterium]
MNFVPSNLRNSGRTWCLVLIVVLAWLVISCRLVYLQYIGHRQFARVVARQQVYKEKIPARPGDILDRNGRLLATTIVSNSLYVVPQRLKNEQNVARICDILQLDQTDFLKGLAANRDKLFLWVKRRLSDQELAAIRVLDLSDDVWGFRQEYRRQYPQGALAAHALGLRDIDGKGQGGLEEAFDHLICGEDGYRFLIRDAHGRVIEVRNDSRVAARNGETLVVTLDSIIQLYTERQLQSIVEEWKPKSACAIVMDVKTCEVLAMASVPTFDLNHPAGINESAWKNTAIASIYEPGSTLKPFIVAAALEKGLIHTEEEFDCEQGEYRMGKRLLHDHHSYGILNVTDVLVKSSNIGMAKIGEKLTNPGLYEAVTAFGFGQKTGIQLPGELSGIVRPLKDWNIYSTGSIPMGQEIAVTPVQLITGHVALANQGKLLNPRLIRDQIDHNYFPRSEEEPAQVRPLVSTPIVSAAVADWLVQVPMVETVSRGTGKKAQLEEYVVFGKTGTAQKPDPKTGKYSSELHVSSFICGAPAHDPRVLVLVVVNEPSVGENHYGGTIAGPPAAEILKQTLMYQRVPFDHSSEAPLERTAQRQRNALR